MNMDNTLTFVVEPGTTAERLNLISNIFFSIRKYH